jgi:nucleotide-binding universal stress UspA family protein
MKTILCPTRGGKESRPNQDFAINLAKERGMRLLFLYVSDIRFISRSALPIVVDIEAELDEVGEFLLAMAQERAVKAKVPTEVSVRRGIFNKVLKEVIAEEGITTVVLGSSSRGKRVTTDEYLQDLGQEMNLETGVEFIVVQDGKLVTRYDAIGKDQG